MRIHHAAFWVLIAGAPLAGGACGGASAPSDGGVIATPDNAVVADMAKAIAAPDLTMNTPVMNDCTADAYVDQTMGAAGDRMIMTTNAGAFDYPCMTILAGQSIEFMWSFTKYPIAPGVAPSHMSDPAGAANTPIKAHTSGALYTVKFPTAGFYPYYVPMHDATMLGTIQVQ